MSFRLFATVRPSILGRRSATTRFYKVSIRIAPRVTCYFRLEGYFQGFGERSTRGGSFSKLEAFIPHHIYNVQRHAKPGQLSEF